MRFVLVVEEGVLVLYLC